MKSLALSALLLLLQDPPPDPRRDALAARLESLRGLKFKTPLTLREGTRREYAQHVIESARRVYGDDLGAAEKGLKALGLLPSNLRLEIALAAQAGLGVKAFCSGGEVILLDPAAGDDWILNKMDLGLVDQHFPPPAGAGTFDERMARAALRMGDAEVAKHLLWSSGKITEEAARAALDEVAAWEKGASKLASAVAPRLFVRAGEFAWRRGGAFALSLYALGGQAELDRAWTRPPRSTEQVIHLDKYAADEQPVAIDPSAAGAFLAKHGYREVYRSVLGELGAAIVLESHFPREDLGAVSRGWAGDAFSVHEKAGVPPLVVWATQWDTEPDAVEFQAQAFRLMKLVVAPDSPLVAPAMRRNAAVVFAVNVPRELQDGLLDAVWTCARTGGVYGE